MAATDILHAAPSPYPGETAPPEAILDLAHAYYDAAILLFQYSAPFDRGLYHAPARLCAIHAIELYLNAFLRFRGDEPASVRARHHDLWDRDFAKALGLRKKTCSHLKWLCTNREYLSVRYAPDLMPAQSHTNRVLATLDEIMKKSRAIKPRT